MLFQPLSGTAKLSFPGMSQRFISTMLICKFNKQISSEFRAKLIESILSNLGKLDIKSDTSDQSVYTGSAGNYGQLSMLKGTVTDYATSA